MRFKSVLPNDFPCFDVKNSTLRVCFSFLVKMEKGQKGGNNLSPKSSPPFSFYCCPLSSLVSSVLRCPVGKICFCFLPEFLNCLFSRFWFKIWFHPYSLCHRIVLTTTGHKSPAGLRHERGVSTTIVWIEWHGIERNRISSTAMGWSRVVKFPRSSNFSFPSAAADEMSQWSDSNV